jgi:hypothetical protein
MSPTLTLQTSSVRLQRAAEEESQDGIIAFAFQAFAVAQRQQFLRLLPDQPIADAVPRRGAPLRSLMAAATSAAINPTITASRVRAFMAARWTPTDNFPSPTSETP